MVLLSPNRMINNIVHPSSSPGPKTNNFWIGMFGTFVIAFIGLAVPPDILVNESSSDLTVTEGENATLKCSAIGYPQPNITWRREDYQPIYINQSNEL